MKNKQFYFYFILAIAAAWALNMIAVGALL